jgi:type VI secretion system protein ImpA
MASPEILDFARLTAPIDGDTPVGGDPRADSSPMSVYYQVKDARSQARAAERQSLMTNGDEDVAADWGPILLLAPEVLASQAKDLEIAAYLIEALARKHGFAGLRDGFRLVREMVEQFADNIYPLPDEDGVETRVAPLTGLNGEGGEGTLFAPINAIHITDYSSVGQFATYQFREAQELDRMPPEARERRLEQGAVDMTTFRIAVGESSAEFYRNLLEDLDGAIDEFTKLGSTLDEKYGRDAPPTSSIREALQTCRETITNVARDKLAQFDGVDEAEAGEDAGAATGEAGGGGATRARAADGAIETREDAFRVISKVADFFRRTEPHTPISYALDRIVRWGRLPLPELLRELISDETSVDQMFKLVGIPKSESSEE